MDTSDAEPIVVTGRQGSLDSLDVIRRSLVAASDDDFAARQKDASVCFFCSLSLMVCVPLLTAAC